MLKIPSNPALAKIILYIKKLFIINIISIPLVLIDYYSKVIIYNFLQKYPYSYFKINQFLNFNLAFNYGISFGIFNDLEYGNIFLVINIIITLYLYHLAVLSHKLTRISYSIIIGGAIGNLFNRYDIGAVVDFIDFHYKEYHFPIFNIADSLITVGTILLIYSMIKKS